MKTVNYIHTMRIRADADCHCVYWNHYQWINVDEDLGEDSKFIVDNIDDGLVVSTRGASYEDGWFATRFCGDAYGFMYTKDIYLMYGT